MQHDAIFKYQALKLVIKHPAFEIKYIGNDCTIHGVLFLNDYLGCEVDSYQIEIRRGNYPKQYPLVFETGGRIPKNIEWHIYPDTGNCCFEIPAEELLHCKAGLTLIDFLEQIVMPYFYNQTYRQVNGFYYNEHKHGLGVVFDYYRKIFNANSFLEIINLLDTISIIEPPPRTSLCFCGSGLKYRKCHKQAYQKLKPLGAAFLQEQAKQLLSLWMLIS